MQSKLTKSILFTWIVLLQTLFVDIACASSEDGLFDRNLPDRQFLEFKAAGFSKPATGVIFRDGGSGNKGVPLGGIGTGCIDLNLDGQFRLWTIYNNLVNPAFGEKMVWLPTPIEQPRQINLPFLGISLNNQTTILSLKPVGNLKPARQIHYWGHYPVVDMEYELDIPVRVGLRAYSPLILGHAQHSNIPGVVFQVFLRNQTNKSQQGTLAFSFPGPDERETLGKVPYQRKEIATVQFNGQEVYAENKSWKFPDVDLVAPFSYCLGVIADHTMRMGGPLNDDAAAWSDIERGLPVFSDTTAGTALAIDFTFAPNEQKNIEIILSWYAPFWPATRYVNRYRADFRSSTDVAKFLVKQRDMLLKNILAQQQLIFNQKEFPLSLRDYLVNCLATIPRCSSYVLWPGADPKSGLLAIVEAAATINLQESMCVAWWGDIPVTFFYPELRLGTLRAIGAYQLDDGRIPFLLGTEHNELNTPNFFTQPTVNGIYYIQMVDRVIHRFPDDYDALVREFYPIIKKSIQYDMTLAYHDNGLIAFKKRQPGDHSQHVFDGWRTWQGNAADMSGHWLCDLQIARRMARQIGDETFARLCSEWIEQGSQTLENLLWNEKLSSYYLWRLPGSDLKSDSILSFQLDGNYHSYATGRKQERIFASSRMNDVLNTIYQKNIQPNPAGAINAIHPDGTPDRTGNEQSGGIWPNMNATLASLYAYQGYQERATELLDKALGNMILKHQLTWNCPQGFRQADGSDPFCGDYYWAMAYWMAAPALLHMDVRQFFTDHQLGSKLIKVNKY